jgi:hypothetical protein
MDNDKNKPTKKDNSDAIVKPDPETLHTTDPQEHMKGPISSIVQGIKEEAEKDDSPKKNDQ